MNKVAGAMLTLLGLLLGACAASGTRFTPTAAPTPAASSVSHPTMGSGGVFVLGGIHESHKLARTYTYERMGEIYAHLKPDVLCVEVEQRFLDDASDHGMPFDFAKFMVPAARKDGIPIVGIDWEAWKSAKMDRWRLLQEQAASDPRLAPEEKLFASLFEQLNAYFVERDFAEVNAPEITELWAAKSSFKYAALKRYPEYASIVEFERDRNEHMLASVLDAVARYPNRRILVGVGIDHKYYLDHELRARGITVLEAQEVATKWWR